MTYDELIVSFNKYRSKESYYISDKRLCEICLLATLHDSTELFLYFNDYIKELKREIEEKIYEKLQNT